MTQHASPPCRLESAKPQALLDADTRTFYQHSLAILTESRVPFLVCGSYALEAYTAISRHTKDLDIFVRSSDCERALKALSGSGYRTELTYPHWLAKAYCGDDFIDIIFSSGNGICAVDDSWFARAVDGKVFGMPVKLCPPEEIIWQKTFIMERERFDGADVAHLLLACSDSLDWPHLLDRFGPHWRVLLVHLILFGFIYPNQRSVVPNTIMRALLERLRSDLDAAPAADMVCQGTLLSRVHYLVDIEHWGYLDARLQPRGSMTGEDIHHWTAAIEGEPLGPPPQPAAEEITS